MEAGRELDALVAEKVMGWVDVRWIDYGTGSAPLLRGKARRRPSWGESEREERTVPAYSTDIAAAWQVAKKLRLAVEPWGDTGWLAWQPPAKGRYCPADTAPLAICLAALKTLD